MGEVAIKRIAYWMLPALASIILLSGPFYWLTGVGQTAPRLSAKVVQQAGGGLANSPKAEALHRLKLPMRLQRMAMYPLLLLAFQLSGGALWLRRWLEEHQTGLTQGAGWTKKLRWLKRGGRWLPQAWRRQLSGADLLATLLFVLIFHLALFLLYLPFNFYRGFILAHQFDLSTQTALGWLSDWGKSVLVALLSEGLPWVIFFTLIRLSPRRWPIPAGALLFLFTIIFAILSPILITPLFFEVRPLTDLDLRSRILTLADRAGMPVDEVYVIDASAKTTQVNAYVTGFGGSRRMVLYDTLLTGYAPDQIEVVLAHELGHWYYRHLFWSVLGLGAAGWLGLFGLQWLLQRVWRPLDLRSPADVAGLPFIMAVIFVVTMLSLPAQNGISRYAENQADQFALTVSQNPDAFITLFTQLAEQNLSIVNPPAWEKFIFYTHPPTTKRVQRAEVWKQHHKQAFSLGLDFWLRNWSFVTRNPCCPR